MTSRYEQYWQDPAPSPLTDPLTAQRRAFLWDRLAQTGLNDARILDCGAGDGSLVAAARSRGHTAAGLEVSQAAIERARTTHPDLDLRLHSVEALPWPVEARSWDVVAAFEVIEHLLEPRALLSGAHDALVDGGALVLSTPFHGLAKNLVIAATKFDSHFAVDGDHVRFFTDRSLGLLLAANGFEVLEIAHLGRRWPLWANSLVWARKS